MTDDNHESLPDELIAELKKAGRSRATITSRVDRHVAAQAREHFSSRSSRRRRAPLWFAAAASVLLGVFAVQFYTFREDTTDIYADVDGSGQIDIADVMVLAQRGGREQAELDAFAQRIVSLGDSS